MSDRPLAERLTEIIRGDVKGWLTADEVGIVITMVAAYPPPNRKDNS